MKTIIIYLIIVFSTLYSCNKISLVKNNEYLSKTISPLEALGFGADTLSCLKSGYSKLPECLDKSFIINNIDDYNSFRNYVSCLEIDNWPLIDFEKYTMLAGIKILGTTCGRLLPNDFSLLQSNSKYVFTVFIQPGGYTAMSAIFYWVLTDKISPKSEIEFVIKGDHTK